MMGDSFINANQTVKVGAVGDTRILKLEKYPVFKSKIKDLRNAILEGYKQSQIELQNTNSSEPPVKSPSQNENKTNQ